MAIVNRLNDEKEYLDVLTNNIATHYASWR